MPQAIENLDEDSSVAGLVPGEEFTVDDLLQALMVASANDAAVTLAYGLAGSEKKFVDAMNLYADDLGLINTTFANASGLDDSRAHSTARDIAFLLLSAQRNSLLNSYSQLDGGTIFNSAGEPHYLQATDKLLAKSDVNVVLAKTGFTDLAGASFAVMSEENGRKLVSVLLDSPDRFAETEELLSYGFREFTWPSFYSGSLAGEEEESQFGG